LAPFIWPRRTSRPTLRDAQAQELDTS
jgi:hypothetical protein